MCVLCFFYLYSIDGVGSDGVDSCDYCYLLLLLLLLLIILPRSLLSILLMIKNNSSANETFDNNYYIQHPKKLPHISTTSITRTTSCLLIYKCIYLFVIHIIDILIFFHLCLFILFSYPSPFFTLARHLTSWEVI